MNKTNKNNNRLYKLWKINLNNKKFTDGIWTPTRHSILSHSLCESVTLNMLLVQFLTSALDSDGKYHLASSDIENENGPNWTNRSTRNLSTATASCSRRSTSHVQEGQQAKWTEQSKVATSQAPAWLSQSVIWYPKNEIITNKKNYKKVRLWNAKRFHVNNNIV